MSYDLLVFDPDSAPKDMASFRAWYHEQVQWRESHGYFDPAVTTPGLRAWFLAILPRFPALSGPFATDDVDDARVTDYSIGRHIIYAGFGWPQAAAARPAVLALAEEHRVGFYDVSAKDGDAFCPFPDGTYGRLPRLSTVEEARLRRAIPARVGSDGWVTCPKCSRRFKASDPRAFAGDTHVKCSQRLILQT